MLNILNCPRCGKIYAKNLRNLCLSCVKILDEECNRCNQYLREHKMSTIAELSKGTGVDEAQIIKFIREKRISIVGALNINYGCELCNASIREGNLCTSCRARMTQDMSNLKSSNSRENKENNSNLGTFFNRGPNDK